MVATIVVRDSVLGCKTMSRIQEQTRLINPVLHARVFFFFWIVAGCVVAVAYIVKKHERNPKYLDDVAMGDSLRVRVGCIPHFPVEGYYYQPSPRNAVAFGRW